MPQYDRCSSNPACACFHMVGTAGIGICGFQWVDCDELVTCEQSNNRCHESNHICVHHPQCNNLPVCYPASMIDRQICPPIQMTNNTTTTTRPSTTTSANTGQQLVIPNIPLSAEWAQTSMIVAGVNGRGNDTNQLCYPVNLFLDNDQTLLIADNFNHRIIQWRIGDTNGQVVAGGRGNGSRLDQLNYPSDVAIDKEMDGIIICDQRNRRVVRWSRRIGTTQGEILIDETLCSGLAMDNENFLYISDSEKCEVRRYRIGDKIGTLVAGENGCGDGLNQFNGPAYIFVDLQQTLYVSDSNNMRVMKWNKGVTVGVIVAGGNGPVPGQIWYQGGPGQALNQVWYPKGLFVDKMDTVYVADYGNRRIMRWPKGAIEGTVIIGGKQNAFLLQDITFDSHGNLYVVDWGGNRVHLYSRLDS